MTVSAAVRSPVRSQASTSPVLREGSRGPAVRALQQQLNQHGARLTVDGSFGPNTERAVRAFQQRHGLTADGVVGPRTSAALGRAPSSGGGGGSAPAASGPTLREGARGEAVRFLQSALNRQGANVAVDGSFGPNTERAVRDFQRRKGLSADGVVGPRTWGALGGAPNVGNVVDFPTGPTRRDTGYRNGRPYSITVALVENGKYLSLPAAQSFRQMEAAARRDGVNLNLVSGFRTMAEQQELYRRYRNGTGNLAAQPGYSNHQSGIAADIETGASRNSAAYRWLRNNAGNFGWRNTVPSEPWHWEFRG
jgi:peptidoglycan hydrolase-like protein with peptidoglycan-binding domain